MFVFAWSSESQSIRFESKEKPCVAHRTHVPPGRLDKHSAIGPYRTFRNAAVSTTETLTTISSLGHALGTESAGSESHGLRYPATPCGSQRAYFPCRLFLSVRFAVNSYQRRGSMATNIPRVRNRAPFTSFAARCLTLKTPLASGSDGLANPLGMFKRSLRRLNLHWARLSFLKSEDWYPTVTTSVASYVAFNYPS
ncbi:hypothetical protein LZ32DRAFT_43698 [Colletotrichum eremochloae]|nr:hypothetical protein LZ32DRAFT_43698 [Colletotrichum eremochloae]